MLNKKDSEKLKQILSNYGFETYYTYVSEQLNKGRLLEAVIDEIYNSQKLKLKKSLGILPQETLPKEILVKNVKFNLTNKPTVGKVEMTSNEELEIDFSCHSGYEGKKEGNKFTCTLKEEDLSKSEQ